ncbi:hypothetical protein ONZ45_g4284 [Pleurotus djamor]|nr:hypothetical protein ONZ45_g4284 [Pleurotus djamor]
MSTTTTSSSYPRSSDIEEQLYTVFSQNPRVYYRADSDVPYVPADELHNIIPAFSEAYGVELLSEEEYSHLKSITADNPGLDVDPQMLARLIAERAPKSDSPSRPPSRPPSRGPPQTPGSGKGPSPFDRRQRATPLAGESQAPPSSWAKRPPPSRRKSDAGSRSDSESYTSPPTAYGRSRAPSNPTSPAPHYASLSSPTFSQTPSRPHSRQSLRMVGSPELIDDSTMMRPLGRLFNSDSDPDSDEEVAMGLIPDRVAALSALSLEEQADQETLQRENRELKKKLLEAETTLQNRLMEHDNELDELQAKLDEMRSELNAAKREEKELRAKERQSMSSITILESEIAKVTEALRIAKETYASLQRQYQEQCAASERYRDDLRKRDENIRSLRDAVNLHEHETSKWTREQQHYEERLSQMDAELAIATHLQAELDAQKQENLTLKETIDRLHFELDEQRNATIQGANVGSGTHSVPGTLSKSLGAELAKNGWGEEEDEKEEASVTSPSIDLSNTSFNFEDESPDEEDFIETIVTRRRRVPTRTNKNEPLTYEEVKEYSDAFTQYESSEFCKSSVTQTDPEPIVPTASSSMQTEEPESFSFAIQTDPEPEPEPEPVKVTCDMDIQTDDLDEFVAQFEELEEPVASTSSSASDSTETPSTPKAKAKDLDDLVSHDQPPAYTQVPQDDGEILRKWHPKPEDLTLAGPISEEAVEEWKALKEELGIDCLVIDKLLASAPRTPTPVRTPAEGKQVRRGRFYNIYNTYIYGKSQSSSPPSSQGGNMYTAVGVGMLAFVAGYLFNVYPQGSYETPGQLGYTDRHLWRAMNTMSPAGEGFTSDTTSAVWSILGRLGGGAAARIARGWPT